MGSWRRRGALPALLLLALSRDAAAYIDPGTGSLVVQGLIAGAAAAAVVIRGYWYRIKAFFRRGKIATKADGESPPPGTPQ